MTKLYEFPLWNCITKHTGEIKFKVGFFECLLANCLCNFSFFFSETHVQWNLEDPSGVPVTGRAPHQFPLPERDVVCRKPGPDPPARPALCLTRISRHAANTQFPVTSAFTAIFILLLRIYSWFRGLSLFAFNELWHTDLGQWILIYKQGQIIKCKPRGRQVWEGHKKDGMKS